MTDLNPAKTRHPVALCREEELRAAITRAISEITCARGLLSPCTALRHLDDADTVLSHAIAAATGTAKTAKQAECEASQSGGDSRIAQPKGAA